MDSEKITEAIKRLKPNKSQQISSTTWIESLPREIIFDILSKLSLSSLVRFNSVCNTWRHLLTQDQTLAAELSAAADNHPCLIFHCDSPIRNQLFFVDLGESKTTPEKLSFNKISVPFCSSLPEYDVVGSCNGLLCLSDSLYSESAVVYNPFTRDFRELPKNGTNTRPEDVVFGFGFSPTTNEYKVLKITYHKSHGTGQVLTFGQHPMTWRSLGKVGHVIPPAGPVLVRGRLHWVATGAAASRRRRSHVASFDVAGERFEEVPTPGEDAWPRRARRECQLFAGAGDRLAAAVGLANGRVEIWVMEEYGVGESWVRVHVVRNYSPKGIKTNAMMMTMSHHRHHNHHYKLTAAMMRRVVTCTRTKKSVKVLCVLKSGEVVLEYREKSQGLVIYDPISEKFKDVLLHGMPNYWYSTVVHFGSLTRIEALIGM